VVRFALAAFVIGALGCSGKPPPKEAPSGPTTRFREGDWVTYRYSGAYTKQAVVLREEVKARDGIKLRIEVSARRGVDERRWIQIVTDTPENKANQVIDELFVVDHDVPHKLPNPKNRDLRALYDWTYVTPESKPENVHVDKREVKLGEVVFTCDVRAGETKVLGRKAAFEEIDCPEFLWTHAGGRFWDVATNEELYRAEVVGFGRTQ
jgi:hypothetical protein